MAPAKQAIWHNTGPVLALMPHGAKPGTVAWCGSVYTRPGRVHRTGSAGKTRTTRVGVSAYTEVATGVYLAGLATVVYLAGLATVVYLASLASGLVLTGHMATLGLVLIGHMATLGLVLTLVRYGPGTLLWSVYYRRGAH